MPTPDHNKQTPRTDAAETINYHLAGEFGKTQWVRADFARQLERESATQLQELKRAKREVKELREILTSGYAMVRSFPSIRTDADSPMAAWGDRASKWMGAVLRALARPAHPEGLADKGEGQK